MMKCIRLWRKLCGCSFVSVKTSLTVSEHVRMETFHISVDKNEWLFIYGGNSILFQNLI